MVDLPYRERSLHYLTSRRPGAISKKYDEEHESMDA